MKLYQFTLPVGKWRPQVDKTLCERFGGFTRHTGYGAWKGSSGILYERVYIYQVAVPEGFAHELRVLVDDYLTSQGEEAMFWAEVGTAEIVSLKGR